MADAESRSGSEISDDAEQQFPRLFGDAENALRVLDVYKSLMHSEEIQKMFEESLDFTKPDVIARLQASTWNYFECFFEGND